MFNNISMASTINNQDNSGKTALMYTIAGPNDETCKIKIIMMLIAAGADVNIKCNEGLTVLDYARISGYNNIVEFLSCITE